MKSFNQNLAKLVPALGVFISRFGMLPVNFSPVGSFGFFGNNIFLFAASILVFDLFFGGSYPGVLFTYIGFFAYYILGKIAHGNTKKQVALLPVASLIFFLLSNLGVFLYWYPSTLEGFIRCYTLALPFFLNTLAGDLIFGYSYLIASKTLFKKNSSKLLFKNTRVNKIS